jgi:hypothetical protein
MAVVVAALAAAVPKGGSTTARTLVIAPLK